MQKPLNVLFLCTHNAARSIMAEAVLNHLGGHRFRAYSAGTHARADQKPHPLTLEVLRTASISTTGLRSKNWSEFSAAGAPSMDLVVTVCDQAAGEPCPVWPGHPATAHWSYPDPSKVGGGHEQQLEAFRQTLHALHLRMELLVQLPLAGIDRLLLEAEARRLAA
ncbi:MAG: arsenate reductase ArsC [Serpentinimonas sp.]|nr:arsenate reductase ArsC [Serpentinimonas sp.]MDO9611120.1 arsenate reductase ArsC [Serpentinimonas sp.]